MNEPKTRRIASNRHQAPVAGPQNSAEDALKVVDPTTLPGRYIVRIEGACLEPELPDGAAVLIEKNGRIASGDFAVLFFKPEHVPTGKHQAILKRVVMAPPHYVKFPFREHPQSDVHALVIVEMTNPHRQFAYKCEHLLGIHKCVGPVPSNARKSLAPVQSAHCGTDGPPAFNATKSTFTRRAIVATAAVLPALVVPAGAALASDEDPELLVLGIEFEKVAVDWVRQRRSDRAHTAEFRARVEAASGIPFDQRSRHPWVYDDQNSPEAVAATAYHQTWDRISDEMGNLGPNGEELDPWEDIHGRMWPLASRIMTYRPKTVAGLAIVARAASFAREDWFNDEHDESETGRSIIEAMCAFCGVTPLPAEI